MSLRSQLLAVSLLLLSLPWAGCQYLREMESTLRQGQSMATDATARAIASALREQQGLLYPVAARREPTTEVPDWYLTPSRRDVIADGYDDDWREQPHLNALPDTPAGLKLFAASRRDKLFMLIEVEDDTLRYRTPSQPGDHLLLHCVDALGANIRYQLSAEAPGLIRARAIDGRRDRFSQSIRGAWRERATGYAVEFQLPLDTRCQRLSIAVIDTQGEEESGNVQLRYDSRSYFSGTTPWLVYQVAELDDWLRAFEEPGRRIEIHDAKDWVVGRNEYSSTVAFNNTDIGTRDARDDAQDPVFWLLRVLYRAVMSGNEPIDSDSGDKPRVQAIAQILTPAGVLGSVEVSETTERYLALTDRASSRVFGISALVLLLAFAGLLSYATLLSWRIRRLRDAARAVAAQTQTPEEFPRSKAGDELGELSRSYADLLRQISEYNAYLRGLARTLSHELRTPIAVVGSSLENLDHNLKDNLNDNLKDKLNDKNVGSASTEQQDYVLRAQEGLSRLKRIVTAMSEASRIEESLEGTSYETLELGNMMRDLVNAYGTSFPQNEFELSLADGAFTLHSNGELIAQALDKLVENAASFATAGSVIELRLYADGGDFVIEVCNRGPTLPAALRERLFEPMVSLRGAGNNEDTHLGLGLHIARTIAQAHGGVLRAADLPAADGVVFSLRLPAG
ncbi:MAG: ATP-binding protein [Congregibacter sp.]